MATLRFFLVLLLAWGHGNAHSQALDAKQSYASAIAMFQAGHFEPALSLAQQGLAQAPDSVPLLTLAGTLASLLRKPDEAGAYWERARSIEPGNLLIAENLVLAYQMAGDSARRDAARARLLELRAAAPDVSQLRPSYVRDDFDTGQRLVRCNEFYVLEQKRPVRYSCAVYPGKNSPADFTLSLVSLEGVSEVAVKQGLIKEGQRIFQLLRSEGKTHTLYETYVDEPSYDRFREHVALVLEGKKQARSAPITASPPTAPTKPQHPAYALVPDLIPVATKAREAVVIHPSMSAYDIEHVIREAVKKAGAAVKTPEDVAAGRETLATLEKQLGPLRQIPSTDLHALLQAFARLEKNTDEELYHLAYHIALSVSIHRSGTGATPETAVRVVMIGEERVWFQTVLRDQIAEQRRRSQDIDGRKYDIWTLKMKSGEERIVYFDVSPMTESSRRILKSRMASPPAEKSAN
jgi:tetratricopeptide (TPR) repeat protein